MDTIDKWLKSLRLHKYTHLFQTMTYEQMLNLDEKYLVDMEVTKGARNKMLVSVKKLNLRHERLINITEDLDHDNISLKEALTTLKEMLLTPIPPPQSASSRKVEPISDNNKYNNDDHDNDYDHDISSNKKARLADQDQLKRQQQSRQEQSLLKQEQHFQQKENEIDKNTQTYHDPYQLTYLFIKTLGKVAQILIESSASPSPSMEVDSSCHGIMSFIVDECLKHNSFTREQKAQVASFRQYFTKESQHHHHHSLQQQHQQQKSKLASYKTHINIHNLSHSLLGNNHNLHHPNNHHQIHHNNQKHQHQLPTTNNHHHQPQLAHHPLTTPAPTYHHSRAFPLSQQNHNNSNINQLKQHQHYNNQHLSGGTSSSASSGSVGGGATIGLGFAIGGPNQAPCLSASLSTIGSPSSTSEEEEQQHHEQNHNQLQLQMRSQQQQQGQYNDNNMQHYQQQQQQYQQQQQHQSSAFYKEYSLLGPGITFELPCLRALAASEKHNRRQLSFLGNTFHQNRSSC